MLQRTAILIIAFVLSSCSLASRKEGRVVTTTKGQTEAIGRAAKKSQATIAAIDAANKHCDKNDKNAVFVDESIAQMRKESSHPGILSKVPVLGDIVASMEDSQVLLRFRCA